MSLAKYNKKRNFNYTNEPQGLKKKEDKQRFVIQHHFARKEHYDFRLEYLGVLISFAVPKGLPKKTNEKRLAVHVEDHPIDYINFEGIIPSGNYGAGSVSVFDKGTYEPVYSIKAGLKKGHLKFYLYGTKYNGLYSLIKTDEPNWLIMKHKSEKNTCKHNPFSTCKIKLAKLTSTIPSKGYAFEIKYDGYRILAFCESQIKLKTRNNLDYSNKFPGIVESLKSFSKTMILDGELVSFDNNGRSDFSLLTDNIKNGKDNFTYVVFDILALDGKDLRNRTLLERKKILEEVFKGTPKNVILSSYVIDKGKESFKLAEKLNLEGIIAKKVDSEYNGERDEDWLKIKCFKRQEFVIGGYLFSERNKDLSAILVGYYKGDKLIYIGKVGTGFKENIRIELAKIFKTKKRKTSPFIECDVKNAVFLKPVLVAEIQFSEITKNNLLRHPSFIGLRQDKDPKSVKLEYERN